MKYLGIQSNYPLHISDITLWLCLGLPRFNDVSVGEVFTFIVAAEVQVGTGAYQRSSQVTLLILICFIVNEWASVHAVKHNIKRAPETFIFGK